MEISSQNKNEIRLSVKETQKNIIKDFYEITLSKEKQEKLNE